MQFMIIRRADAATEAGALPSPALAEEMARYFRKLDEAGVLRMVQGLDPSARAVRLGLGPDGATLDRGPFDARELAAGFVVIEAESKEAAVAWARQWPAAEAGAAGELLLEVRETGCPGGCARVPPPASGEGRRYLVLLRSDGASEADAIPARARLDALDAFNAEQAAAGVLLAGDGLKSSARGARLSIKAGGATVIDGPFAEAKELIAGFWMIRAASMDEAVAWARAVPYPTGPEVVVEIRAEHGAERGANLVAGLLDEALRQELAPRLA